MASKQQQLDDIKQQILDQKICPELAGQAIQMVFGDGNPDADIVFVGEAPGKKEDESGLPFVGAAGKFLNEMLASINLERKDIYITNIVKYRPPENRDPKPEEKEEFLPFLQAQLEVIDPKIVVTLGRHSGASLLPGLQISSDHGQLKEYEGRAILPLYHPAAALYNGGMRKTLLEDFANIPKILATIK